MAKTAKPKPLKIPATPGAAIDFLHKTRLARKQLEAQAELKKAEEDQIEEVIFEKFKKGDLEGARGKLAQASISRSDVPTLDDWDKLAKHVLATGELDLLHRRVAVEAVRARWNDKKSVPGVGVFTRVRLHLTTVKS